MKIDRIIYSKRKTISLEICDDATLIIRAPLSVTDDALKKVIEKHLKWLKKKKQEALSRNLDYVQKEFISGEKFLFLGMAYPLKIVTNNGLEEALIFSNETFLLAESVTDRKKAFISWYKKKAYQIFSERVRKYSSQYGLCFDKVKVSNANRRWGSCSTLGNLSFSWRLVMAPLEIIDYVVIHELAHLLERNHSKDFWSKVSMFMPDYKIHKNWIHKNGYRLKI